MPNNIAAEWPIDNDGIIWCEIVKDEVNLTTGDIDKDLPVVGRSDIQAFWCTEDTLDKRVVDAIHADLVYALANVSGTHRYYVYPQGDVATLRLLAHVDQKRFLHFIGGDGDWHEVAETTIVNKRTAAG